MCPPARRLVNGDGSLFERGFWCAHCLLVETPRSGLVLVDTGIGSADIADPVPRLGRGFVLGMAMTRPKPAMAAIEQVRALGLSPKDVRHVIPTHLDVDHAGGIPDFPWAKVHVHFLEKTAALAPTTWKERERYRPAHFAHGPDFVTYERTGEAWMGFAAVRDLPGLPPEVLAIPLPGHTRGHACIAVRASDRWLLHAGDAYFNRAVLASGTRELPAGVRVFERQAAIDYDKVLENHVRLAALARAHVDEVTVFSAHDPVELAALRARSAAARE